MQEIIYPKDKEAWLKLRTKDITSTEISALFGMSPYFTKFELWHRKKSGEIPEFSDNNRMKWGRALQDAIAYQISGEKGFKVRKMEEYIRDSELRIGASFDFSIEEAELGLLEVKNVDYLQFKDNWIEDEDKGIEAPYHIELQVQHQLLVSGRQYAYIGALIGGNDEKLIYRKRDEEIIAAIKREVALFWKSIEENNPPKIDFEKDAKFIRELYSKTNEGKTYDATGENNISSLVFADKMLAENIKSLELKRDAIKAEILTVIEDSEKVFGDNFSISCKLVAEKQVEAYTRKEYRSFRITHKKEK